MNNLDFSESARISNNIRTILLSLFALIGLIILVFAIFTPIVSVDVVQIATKVFMAALIAALVGAVTLVAIVVYQIRGKKILKSNGLEKISTELSINNRSSSTRIKQQPRSYHSNFLIYENSTYRMKMQYPQNWEVHEDDNVSLPSEEFVQFVRFISPRKTNSGLAGESEEMLKVYIRNIPFPNLSLDEYARNHISHLKSTFQKSMKFTLIEFRPIALAKGSIAQTIIYKVRSLDENEIKTTEVLTMKGDNMYLIKFTSKSSKYSDNLPILQEMVDSFE